MKLGIIGPEELVLKIKNIIETDFNMIKPICLIYNEYSDAPKLAEHYQPLVDVLLFSGKTPYTLAYKKVISNKLWEYIPRHGSSFLRALLEAHLINNYNIFNVSFDTYNPNLLLEAYDEIGIPREKLNLYFAKRKLYSKDFENSIYYFHRDHFNEGKVACCATALYNVYLRLENNSIPNVFICPTNNIIRESLRKVQYMYYAEINKQSQIVAIMIQIDSVHENSILNGNDYQNVLNQMKISEEIYQFAQRIKAAVIENNSKEYILFSTKKFVELETNNFKKLDLIKFIKMNSFKTASIGIGYGETAIEAKQNANYGMLKSSKLGGNMAHVVMSKDHIIGPIKSNDLKEEKEDKVKFDKKLYKISEDTDISINSLFKIYNILSRYKKDTFTPSEISKIYGVSLRSMNRIIEKLELNGYCSVVGKVMNSDKGRPSRIIKFNL